MCAVRESNRDNYRNGAQDFPHQTGHDLSGNDGAVRGTNGAAIPLLFDGEVPNSGPPLDRLSLHL